LTSRRLFCHHFSQVRLSDADIMTDGSHFLDIILFAMVAVFLGLRLRSVLGRRTGNERPPPGIGLGGPPVVGPHADPVVDPDQRRRAAAETVVPLNGDNPLNASLARIRTVDPSFTPQSFLKGATTAFAMVVQAFAEGDEAALRPLLSDEVYENFAQAIRARRAAGEISETKLLQIISADIVEATLDGRMAHVAVRFVTQQTILVRDAQGNVVEGDPTRPAQITDLWTFERDTRSPNVNWLLIATRSLDE
jgi:predicted lipid-binding transport protein (Tim44 family)